MERNFWWEKIFRLGFCPQQRAEALGHPSLPGSRVPTNNPGSPFRVQFFFPFMWGVNKWKGKDEEEKNRKEYRQLFNVITTPGAIYANDYLLCHSII